MILQIDTQDALPIYAQLRDQIVLGIAGGRLEQGEALPSVRRLGADLGINFHTVSKAYTALHDEGYIVMDRRRGAVVARRTAGGADFLSKLGRNITLSAAEAVCHNMGGDEFMAFCAECYRNVNGEKGDSS
ncbi:MAG: GntR family transcriptional regulator [Oscillospiraceae bacterium]|nr:GntR family transcriptional regulator [Oscillospiraceae bacterium]